MSKLPVVSAKEMEKIRDILREIELDVDEYIRLLNE